MSDLMKALDTGSDKENKFIWIVGGDLNLPGIDWETRKHLPHDYDHDHKVNDLGLRAGSIYRSIAILAKVRYRYLVVSRYFDIFGNERPLFGDCNLATNYHTVSLSSICCKLLDHVMRTETTLHLDQHSITMDTQQGFHK